jgi:hypothetical protein
MNLLPCRPTLPGLLVLALAFAALLTFAAPSRAQTQFLPQGSYQESCRDFIFFMGGGLSAVCRHRDGHYGARSALQGARRCPWVENNDGTLACASAHERCVRNCEHRESRRPGDREACLNGCPR